MINKQTNQAVMADCWRHLTAGCCLWIVFGAVSQLWASPITSGMVLWARADNGVATSGSAVTTWTDQTDLVNNTTANNATQTIAANRPALLTNQRNTLPAIEFDAAAAGNGDYLLFNSPAPQIVSLNAAGSGISVFSVARSDTSDKELVGLRGATNPLVQLDKSVNNPRFIVRDSNGTAASAVSTSSVGVNEWGIYGGTFSRSAASGFSGSLTTNVYYQGGGNVTATTLGATGNMSYSDQQIGGTNNGSGATLVGTEWDGQIGEVLIFNGVLSSSQRILVENNLSSKYDIALDTANGAKDRYAGDAVGYDFNVIGIGRDVGSTNKVISSPDNRNGLLLAELNTSLSADNEWLLAGEKTTTNTLVTTLLPGGVGQRWSRVWNLDKTGSVDATLTFDFSESGLSLTGTNYALLYSLNDASTFSTLSTTFSLSAGDRISFNVLDLNLADGFYTLGIVPEPSSLAISLVAALSMFLFVRRRSV